MFGLGRRQRETDTDSVSGRERERERVRKILRFLCFVSEGDRQTDKMTETDRDRKHDSV